VSEVLVQGQTSFVDSTTVTGNTYFYQVRAVNANGTSVGNVLSVFINPGQVPAFIGSVATDGGTQGTFYIQVIFTPQDGIYSSNRWKCIAPWGFAQGYSVGETIRQLFDKGSTPARLWLETGKSEWFNPPQIQTAPDPTHEVGSK
jgi:hypothetical protein